jgi:succinate dehydrogenase / fumarate reductase iron-sulfur subunit
MTQALRFSLDSRDEGIENRKKVLDSNHGLWSCHFAGACSSVCPKGVDPALAIQLLKQSVIRSKFGGKAKKTGSAVVSPPTTKKSKIKTPPYTV